MRKPFAASITIAVLCCCAWNCARAAEPGAGSAGVATLGVAELRAGQKAVVKTVFKGYAVEEFEAEIVGVVHNGRADGDLILARATSERVVRSGVAQGMSGSPVYVGGKLIGALSFGWQFSRDPVFGVTPIGEMLGILDHDSLDPEGSSAGPSGAEASAMSSATRFGEFTWSDAAPGQPVSPGQFRDPRGSAPSLGLEPLGLPLACAGLDASAFEFARGLLAPLRLTAVPGGSVSAPSPVPHPLEAGSAIAVDLLRGDLQFSAIGTATWVSGGRVLGFGHPFFQSGNVRLPLSTAEIATIIASDAISFKLGARGQTVGAILQDRRPGIAGVLGAAPHLLPFTVSVRGGRPKPHTFSYEIVEDRNLAPTLIAVASLNSVLESGGSGANQTLRWSLTLHRHGFAPLTLSDVAAGDAPPNDLANGILGPVRFLFANPYGRLTLDSVSVAVDAIPGRGQWTVRDARLLGAVVRPGGTVRIACELERWRGQRETRVIALDVPEEAPSGRYVLWIGGGAELMRYEAQRLPGRYRPTSLDDAWDRMRQVRSTNALYATLLARAPEVTSDGRDYPELPASAVPLLASGLAGGDRGRRGDLAKLDEKRFAIDGQLRGEIVISVEIDDHAPLAP